MFKLEKIECDLRVNGSIEERDEDAERYRDLGRASWPTGADDAS